MSNEREVSWTELGRTTSDEFIEDRKEGGHEVNWKKFLGTGVKYVNSRTMIYF